MFCLQVSFSQERHPSLCKTIALLHDTLDRAPKNTLFPCLVRGLLLRTGT